MDIINLFSSEIFSYEITWQDCFKWHVTANNLKILLINIIHSEMDCFLDTLDLKIDNSIFIRCFIGRHI